MILGLIAFFGQVAFAEGPEPTLLMQSWITAWDQDQRNQADPSGYGDPEDDPGFKLRRARAGFEGTEGAVHYGVLFGMAAPADGITGGHGELQIVDAYGGWQMHRHLALRAGVQKVPFGREQLLSASELVFQERTTASNHLTPGRELGLVAFAGPGTVLFSVGAFNGNGSLLGDDNAGLLIAARGQYNMGNGGLDRTWGTVEGFSLSIGANGLYDRDLATDEMGVGADLLLRVGALAVLAEGLAMQLQPTATDVAPSAVLAKTQRIGGQLQVGYSIGALEPAVRVELFDDNRDEDDNGDLLHVIAGVTGHYLEDQVRAGVGFVHRQELGGKDLANDTARIWLQMRY